MIRLLLTSFIMLGTSFALLGGAWAGTDKTTKNIESHFLSLNRMVPNYIDKLANYSGKQSDVAIISMERHDIFRLMSEMAYILQTAYPRVVENHLTDKTLTVEVLNDFQKQFNRIREMIIEAEDDHFGRIDWDATTSAQNETVPSAIEYNSMPDEHKADF